MAYMAHQLHHCDLQGRGCLGFLPQTVSRILLVPDNLPALLLSPASWGPRSHRFIVFPKDRWQTIVAQLYRFSVLLVTACAAGHDRGEDGPGQASD